MSDWTKHADDALMILDGDGDSPHFDALVSVASYIADNPSKKHHPDILDMVKEAQMAQEIEENGDDTPAPPWHEIYW